VTILEALELPPFRQRFPWLGSDLQTLRDTLRASRSELDTGPTLEFPLSEGDRLVATLDPPRQGPPLGLVVVIHGLGGGSDAAGPRRLGRSLRGRGMAVLRLNLRGAGPGRPLAKGTYAANCDADLLPVLLACRRLAAELAAKGSPLPLGAVGISLGGTVLLNALLTSHSHESRVLDGLVCVSSPLDLPSCAERIERPRNALYQSWLVRRLIEQTLADPHGLSERERQSLTGPDRPRTIRAFDDLITAPRWGFSGVADYYNSCSPIKRLSTLPQPFSAGREPSNSLPPVLLMHAKDDPWVPVEPALSLAQPAHRRQAEARIETRISPEVLITDGGGHNGFHAPGDTDQGCWSDQVASRWLGRALVVGE